MKDITKEESAKFPKSGRVKIVGAFRSDDGLVEGIGGTGRGFVESYDRISRESKEAEAKWVADLRSIGIKASHPDDGWHARDEEYFQLSYPRHNDGIQVGDKVALGSPTRYLVLTVKEIKPSMFGFGSPKYFYERF